MPVVWCHGCGRRYCSSKSLCDHLLRNSCEAARNFHDDAGYHPRAREQLFGEREEGAPPQWPYQGGTDRVDLPQRDRHYVYYTVNPVDRTIGFGRASEWTPMGGDRTDLRHWNRDRQNRLAGLEVGKCVGVIA